MSQQITDLPLSQVIPNRALGNDRTVFDETALRELAESIRINGLAQPITVRCVDTNAPLYEVIAGERRYRAHKLIDGQTTIRAIIVDMDDKQASAVMLAENTGRKDLDPIDEARAYQRRLSQGWDKRDLAQKAGVSQQVITNRVKLLALRDDLQQMVRTGQLQVGYAQVIADAALDTNRQLIAFRKLSSNPAPTPTWLRQECAILAEAQAQTDMFDNVLFSGATFDAKITKAEFIQQLPPDPRKDAAPLVGNSHHDILSNQITFWQDAADKWQRLGKTANRDRCLAAAQSLKTVLDIMPRGRARKARQAGKTYLVYEMGDTDASRPRAVASV
jgi:ParB/RepB/Spo0J family partition protein